MYEIVPQYQGVDAEMGSFERKIALHEYYRLAIVRRHNIM